MDSGLTTPASFVPSVSLRTVDQPTTTDSSTYADQPSVVAVLPPANQPPAADQGSPNLIIIGVVVILAVVVAACVVIVTVAALCSIKRPCVKGVPLEEGTFSVMQRLIPYVAKCSRSIIFANFANGAHSRILLFANFYARRYTVYIYLCTHYYNYGGVTLRWRTSMEALCLVKPSSG